MSRSRKSPCFSLFLLCLVFTTLFCSLSVQSDSDPVGEVLDQTKNVTQTAADHTKSFIDGTTSTLNDTKNAAENAIHRTTTAYNDTKNAAENVISDTRDAYHGVENVANDVKGNGAAEAHTSPAGHEERIFAILLVIGLCFSNIWN
ncbi:hypothetical protein MANES_02G044550v8 [Manihot esculenta]|uniref:Uncharacterized protein n=2 Tax=Manihot esculenta TaxID=3983 RepID=A0A199U9W2_MANES|nr:hypothetical protein MANES_02G044550v8 [Manihot esculenta]